MLASLILFAACIPPLKEIAETPASHRPYWNGDAPPAQVDEVDRYMAIQRWNDMYDAQDAIQEARAENRTPPRRSPPPTTPPGEALQPHSRPAEPD